MRIVCEASVQNRLAPNVIPRLQQSTVAVGIHPPNSKDPDNVFIIHFSTTNKNGTRYKIKRNIDQVFTKFVTDGKTTISFKQPQHNLQIRCDPVQLKCFLRTLKMAIEGKAPQNLGLSSLAVTAVPQKNLPMKKMTITKPSEYPMKGLPRTLQTLIVTGLGKHSIESQILNLSQLRVLHLTKNSIGKVPKKLGEMQLVELDLSENRLDKATNKDWDWANGPIKHTLQTLNISVNRLQYFPYQLVKLHKLHTLNLGDNGIERIPFAIRRLKNLRFFNLAKNCVKSLPNTMTRMQFNTVDVSGEKMFGDSLRQPSLTEERIIKRPPKLWQLAAKSVLSKRIPYSMYTLPEDVIMLLEEAPFCQCGKLCLPSPENVIQCAEDVTLKAPVIHFQVKHIPGDTVYCNAFCRFTYQRY